MQKYKKILILSLLIGIIYLAFGVHDLKYYGPNWDEPVHFGRGHAFLYFLTSGKTNYKDFGVDYEEGVASKKRSYYQSNAYALDYFEEKFREWVIPITGAGHPPVSDVLGAVFNIILYQKLKILGDIESHHFFSVFITSFFVAFLFYFVSRGLNIFAGFVTVLAVTLYPLFLGESRYNTKDIPEAVFYGISALFFYKGIVEAKVKWIILSSLFFALAFGTKFNILFLPFTLLSWLIFFSISKIKTTGFYNFINSYRKIIRSFIFFPIFSLLLLYILWPTLWTDTLKRFLYNFSYYRSVGILEYTIDKFSILGFNFYAPLYIFFTTPLIILFLSIIGIIYTLFFGFKEKNKFSLFVLFWFIVPIIRVMLPHVNIYGGVRQIVEFVPAMAILAGIGAYHIVTLLRGFIVRILKLFNNRAMKKSSNHISLVLQSLILVFFIPITLKIISLHPNQSAYFNPLVGDIAGARALGISGWGNSLGSTYRQGVLWLNKHAEPNAKLAFVYELRSNIALSDLRGDIELNNQIRSGVEQRGEYIIGVTHDGARERSFHREYLERFLYPVYMVEVEGVPLLKIWKNDRANTKPRYQKDQKKHEKVFLLRQNSQLLIDLFEVVRITKVEISYLSNNCTLPKDGYFEISQDGNDWSSTEGSFAGFPLSILTNTKPKPGLLQFWFAGDRVRYIRVIINDQNSCLLKNQPQVTVFKI